MGFTACPLTSFFLSTTMSISFDKMAAALMGFVEDKFIEKEPSQGREILQLRKVLNKSFGI